MVEKLYLVYKTLHVFGAIVFLGNLIVTALWKTLADRTRDPVVVAFGQRLVTVTDAVFTGGGAILVFGSGMLMMVGPYEVRFWTVPWLAWGIALFLISVLIWILVLIPVQMKQAALARSFAAGGDIPPAYWRLGRVWMVFGAFATVLPLINVALMVMKPV